MRKPRKTLFFITWNASVITSIESKCKSRWLLFQYDTHFLEKAMVQNFDSSIHSTSCLENLKTLPIANIVISTFSPYFFF